MTNIGVDIRYLTDDLLIFDLHDIIQGWVHVGTRLGRSWTWMVSRWALHVLQEEIRCEGKFLSGSKIEPCGSFDLSPWRILHDIDYQMSLVVGQREVPSMGISGLSWGYLLMYIDYKIWLWTGKKLWNVRLSKPIPNSCQERGAGDDNRHNINTR